MELYYLISTNLLYVALANIALSIVFLIIHHYFFAL